MSIINLINSIKHSKIPNYILPGVDSYLLHGDIRILESCRDTREFVTPHSHRRNLHCTVIQGEVLNVEYQKTGSPSAATWYCSTLRYLSKGEYQVIPTPEPETYYETYKRYSAGDSYTLLAQNIHSISFKKGTVLMLQESGEPTPSSVILEPAGSDGQRIPTFHVAPWMFK